MTNHAKNEIARRQITFEDIAKVLADPEQTMLVRSGREVYQSRITSADPQKTYLIRVVVDIDRQPAVVVTAYRTSKIEKYWREDL
ncbi:MAG: DUF4258 domain-containing protein [Anaerolineales bacterium]